MPKSRKLLFGFFFPILGNYAIIVVAVKCGGNMNYEGLKIPNHVAIIMDGNGRWAKERGMTRSEGHKAGFSMLKKLTEYIFSRGIKVLSVYAFSTENFKRSKQEVNFLMNLFETKFKEYADIVKKKGIRVVFSGKKASPLPDKVIRIMQEIEEDTKENKVGILNLCVNYGGHLEIVEATKKICKLVQEGKLSLEEITEENFSHYLFQDLPPIDFMIRTSGEIRISNFMLYQLSYAEMYFSKVYFPSFDCQCFDDAILAYNKRNRRFGGIQDENENN